MKINDLPKKIKGLPKAMADMIDKGIIENKDFIKQANIQQMQEHGIRSDESSLGEYAQYTIERKKEKGQPYDHVTLHDTGRFHEKMYVKKEKMNLVETYNSYSSEFTIGSKDKKEVMLIREWGSDIFGLTPMNMKTLSVRILPVIKKLLTGYWK
jgi:hypothetical protein